MALASFQKDYPSDKYHLNIIVQGYSVKNINEMIEGVKLPDNTDSVLDSELLS